MTQLKDNPGVNTTLVLISNLMTWFNTPNKTDQPEGQEEEQEQPEEEEKTQDLNSILKDF